MRIIEADMIKFNKDYDLKNKSGFINKVISNYYDDFPLSLNVALKQMNVIQSTLKHEDFGKDLAKTVINKFSEQIMKNLIDEYKVKYDSQNQFKMKLNNENAELFESLEEALYFNDYAPRSGIAFYLKVLLESYALLSREEREKVYYREVFELLKKAIKNKTFIKLKVKDSYKKVTPVLVHKPIKNPYHNLIYLEVDGEHYRILNVDIKKIISIKNMKEKSPVELSLRNVVIKELSQFVNRESYKKREDFRIEFTKYGLERFVIEEDDIPIIGIPDQDNNKVYTFKATETDIFNHLFKFALLSK
jgi:hypothetical protein